MEHRSGELAEPLKEKASPCGGQEFSPSTLVHSPIELQLREFNTLALASTDTHT